MSAGHDQSGDYGYDLVQEVKAALHLPLQRRSSHPVSGLRSPGRELDPDADFGYDQAHEG